MSTFDKLAADKLADEVAKLVDLGTVDYRSRAADALYAYRGISDVSNKCPNYRFCPDCGADIKHTISASSY